MPIKLFGVHGLPNQLDNHKPRALKQSPLTSPVNSPAGSRRNSINMDHIKRPTLAGFRMSSQDKKQSKERSLSKDKNAKEQRSPSVQPKPVKLNMIMESPPVLFIGSPQQSQGALISGRVQIAPLLPEATLNSVSMYLECATTTKRPVVDRCRECSTQVVDLFEWHFFLKPKVFTAANGMQDLPFSYLLPGHLPATTHGHIGSIDYSLHVRAKSIDGQEIEFRREVILQRALIPGNEKNSVRIFPPTNLTLHVTVPSVVHPIGEFPVTCRMTGITTKKEESQVRWRLRKLLWRIEETETAISPACGKHTAKLGGDGKGIQHENTREVGMDELKQGWKTDFSDGIVEGEFMAAINGSAKPQCDMQAQNGLKIGHTLILELVIAEEWAMNKKPGNATPTGAARVLRTQFNLNVTERLGMGLSWMDEEPPRYEDVPHSPPHYQGEHTTIVEYDGEDLHEDVEDLTLNPPTP